MKLNTHRSLLLIVMVAALGVGGLVMRIRAQAPELAQGYLPELALTSRQLLQLAEAVPAGKFGWRPAPGVRSVSEVYMHLALGNYFLLERAGVKTGFEMAKLGKDPEKAVTDKAEVIRLLRMSLDAVASAYKTADRQQKVQIFNRDAVADGVFLRILLHNNEHMGQSIAYARMNGVTPPWSQ
jgi:uncharacterized damage-inducible protein DinB